MAAASLVATAFGIIIIIITAYVLAGGTLLTSEVVTTAQKDMTAVQVKMLGTSIRIENTSVYQDGDTRVVIIFLDNTGNEPILDYSKIDVYVSFDDEVVLYRYNIGNSINSWNKENYGIIYPSQWDPGEKIKINVFYSLEKAPIHVKIVTNNGITAESPIPFSRS